MALIVGALERLHAVAEVVDDIEAGDAKLAVEQVTRHVLHGSDVSRARVTQTMDLCMTTLRAVALHGADPAGVSWSGHQVDGGCDLLLRLAERAA